MKKIIKEVNKEQGVFQITTIDERWYTKQVKNSVTGLPDFDYYPSVTWITESYPKGIGFYKWLADKGWDEAEALKQAAGDKGSKVHLAIVDLIDGKTVSMESRYINPTTEKEEELTLEEYDAIVSFSRWWNDLEDKPKVLAREIVVFNDEHRYAGTMDLVVEWNKEIWIIDFKTSAYIWPSFELQLSAYKNALLSELPNELKNVEINNVKLGILQVGYRRNKDGYKFTEIEDQFDLFLAAKKIWRKDHGEEKPKQRNYPLEVSLVEEPKEIKVVKIKKSK